jgi:hypothetical protein
MRSNIEGPSAGCVGRPRCSVSSRADDFLVSSGGTILQAGDTLLVLVNKGNLGDVRAALERRAANTDLPSPT